MGQPSASQEPAGEQVSAAFQFNPCSGPKGTAEDQEAWGTPASPTATAPKVGEQREGNGAPAGRRAGT